MIEIPANSGHREKLGKNDVKVIAATAMISGIVAGGVTGSGIGAGVGLCVLGPPGAAVGFLIGLTCGTLGGFFGTAYTAIKIQRKLEAL